jgi:DNA primase large subunit
VKQAHHSFGQDERIAPLLGLWSNGYLSSSSSSFGTGAVIDISKIDSIADAHYPLCMRTTHRALRANHHLMHGGRMQYGLFLKGIGVTLDDSLSLWRSEFTKKPDIDEKIFNSRYAYNIRSNQKRRFFFLKTKLFFSDTITEKKGSECKNVPFF